MTREPSTRTQPAGWLVATSLTYCKPVSTHFQLSQLTSPVWPQLKSIADLLSSATLEPSLSLNAPTLTHFPQNLIYLPRLPATATHKAKRLTHTLLIHLPRLPAIPRWRRGKGGGKRRDILGYLKITIVRGGFKKTTRYVSIYEDYWV
jgi:hypothetical protein